MDPGSNYGENCASLSGNNQSRRLYLRFSASSKRYYWSVYHADRPWTLRQNIFSWRREDCIFRWRIILPLGWVWWREIRSQALYTSFEEGRWVWDRWMAGLFRDTSSKSMCGLGIQQSICLLYCSYAENGFCELYFEGLQAITTIKAHDEILWSYGADYKYPDR